VPQGPFDWKFWCSVFEGLLFFNLRIRLICHRPDSFASHYFLDER
jgi:hypothetical protein